MFSISSRLRQFSKTCNYPIYLESFLYQNKIHGSIRKLYPMKICHLKSCPLLFKYSLGTYQRRYSKSRIYKMWIFSHPTIRLILLEPLIFPRAIYTFMLSSCSNLIGRSSSSSWLFFRSGLLRHHHWLYPPLPDCRSISSSLLASVYSGSPLISQHFASWKKKKKTLYSLLKTLLNIFGGSGIISSEFIFSWYLTASSYLFLRLTWHFTWSHYTLTVIWWVTEVKFVKAKTLKDVEWEKQDIDSLQNPEDGPAHLEDACHLSCLSHNPWNAGDSLLPATVTLFSFQ